MGSMAEIPSKSLSVAALYPICLQSIEIFLSNYEARKTAPSDLSKISIQRGVCALLSRVLFFRIKP